MWVAQRGDNIIELSPTGATLGMFAVGSGPGGSRSTARTCGLPTPAATTSPSCRRRARRSAPTPWAQPQGIAFDGTNMWVTNMGNDNATKLSPAGATLGTYPVGDAAGSRSTARTCGSPTGATTSPSCRRRARRSAPTPWAPARRGSRSTARTCGSPTTGGQQRHQAVADGRDARHLRLGSDQYPQGIAFDGTNTWVVTDGNVTKLSSAGATLGVLPWEGTLSPSMAVICGSPVTTPSSSCRAPPGSVKVEGTF